ncbi:TPR end-of-group domain-containing protein [Pseudoalteromonas sp. T1lg76]|uniref:TPR end-of-group domain-containing protein n=1 Tax=Pseudoalteromonas sp. T1lg76 TaxID=2077103 RepID=UPI000CF72233|nr:hypothetical protein [Pseudoalteromonas sp. T1lg76]
MSYFKGIESKFPWSFSGFILAIFFGGLSIYLGFFNESKADLNFIISSSSAVLDIKEEVGKLDILYDGESLSKSKQDLQLITLRVVNQGNMAISKQSYDLTAPVGFEVLEGKLAEPPKIVNASQQYLKNKAALIVESDTKVTFSEVIIDAGNYFDIKLLIMYGNGDEPKIESFGKIASLDRIDVVYDTNTVESRSFLDATFVASIGIQITRVVIYGILFICVLVVLGAFLAGYDAWKEKKEKRELVKLFKSYNCNKLATKDTFFFNYFVSNQSIKTKHLLTFLERAISDSKLLMTSEILSVDSTELNVTTDVLLREEIVIPNDGEGYRVCPSRIEVFKEFVEFLNRHEEFSKKVNLSSGASADIKVVDERVSNVSEDMNNLKFEQLKLQGAVALNEGNYQKGIDYFNEYLNSFPQDPSVLWKLACCQKRMGELGAALTSIESAIKFSEEVTYLMHYNYACYLALNGRELDLIIEQLRKALTKDKDESVRNQIPKESDFEGIKHNVQFIELLKEFEIV